MNTIEDHTYVPNPRVQQAAIAAWKASLTAVPYATFLENCKQRGLYWGA